jgi:signal transduction histidine kinase
MHSIIVEREAVNELKSALQQFSMLDFMPVGVCVLREDLTVLFWNKCLEQWTGILRQHIVGSPIDNQFRHFRTSLYMTRLQRIFQGGPPLVFSSQLHQYVIPAPLPTGQLRIQHATVTAVPAQDGTGYHALFTLQDVTDQTRRLQEYQQMRDRALTEVTERRQAEEALQRYAAELQRSNQELEQFAYVSSHDLQEPLRMVASYCQLLQRRYAHKLDPAANEFIGYAVAGVTRMQSLIRDLLLYSRLGRQGAPFGRVDSAFVLTCALGNLSTTLAESEAEVTHDPLPSVIGDERKLVQLFQNLIGNAIKYCDKQPPRVHIRAEHRDGMWEFLVQDNGIGIEEQYAEQIFGVFQRLHTRDEYPGTGIGLAICKKIAEQHGGRIWVESTLGQGACFHFTIADQGA